ncbi:hypothetical protein LSAT2_029577 [Lamellibrachia satsuma]|nr:hypothetical protein LSAT2_029577 [Lamellibrachia satsuma]
MAAPSATATMKNGIMPQLDFLIGANWMNEDCSMQLSCVVCETCTRPVGKIVTEAMECDDGEECVRKDGVSHCQNGAAQWSDWSSWGECSEPCGKGIQTRTRNCSKEAMCDGESSDTRDCVCDMKFSAGEDCEKCNKTSSYIGYVADKCNCTRFYQCHLTNGGWRATVMSCPACLQWNSATLTCDVSVDTPCETVTASDVSCYLRAVDDDVTKFVMPAPGQDVIMNCPVGTVFDLSECNCVLSLSPQTTTQTTSTTTVVAVPDEVTCVNFDSGWNGFASTNWVYVQPINVDREPSAFVNSAAKFDGYGHLEIPRFSNSYGRWKQFAVSFCYKRSSVGGTATQGLVNNGNCVSAPSISITSGQGTIAALLTTESGTVTVSGIAAADDVWHHVDLSYDGMQVHLCVDGTCHLMGQSQGAIGERHCPMVIGQLEASGSGFTGYMDELCFYDKALSTGVVKKLQDKFFPA